MIAKFNSKCFVCTEGVLAGTDVYYEKGQGTAHWNCLGEDPAPSPSQIQLAERLGFKHYDFSGDQ